jgi:tRNA pseudouridine38-40 synthase
MHRLTGFTQGVLLKVAYDGTHFKGWASQRGERTVAETLKGAIHAIDPHASAPRGTSRTDAGVHAEGQMVAFDATREVPCRGWVLGLNQHLPDDVAVRAARTVDLDFNPRFASRGKRYRYRLLLDRVRDPLWAARSWRVGYPLDRELLRREAATILGTHDFAAFRSSHDERTETTRTMTRVAIEETDDRILGIVIEGTAFLHNMIRILAGTLVDVARGRLPEGTISRAIAEKDRRLAGTTAPGQGLTLEAIELSIPEGASEPWPQ